MPPSYVTAHQENLRGTVDERLWFAGEASSEKYYGICFDLSILRRMADMLNRLPPWCLL